MLFLAQQLIPTPDVPEPDAARMVALVLLFLAMSGGAVLATMHVRGRVPPWPFVLVHGALGLGALTATFIDLKRDEAVRTMPMVAFGCLLVTALGAFTFFALRLMKKKVPIPLIGAHAAFAVTAFIVLLVDSFRDG